MEEAVAVGTYVHDLFINRLSTFPLYIVLSLLVMLLSFIGIVELLIYILIKRLLAFINKKRNEDLKDKIVAMLANVLVFSDNDDPKAVVKHFLPRFSRIPLYRASVRKLLVLELLRNHSNFSGRASEILREVYLQLNLDKKARKDLSSRNSNRQMEAIKELTEMLVKEECPKILIYTNSEYPELRVEAQAAFIRLCSDNPFCFLDTVRQPILNWHQIILFEVITKTESMARPRFSNWLNSNNDSLVSFSLKLIEYYQQLDAVPNLIYLINHYNLIIRGTAIEILGRMEAEMAESHLIDAYPNQPQSIQVKILNTLGLIGSENSIPFILAQSGSKDFSIKIAAMKALKAYKSNGRELLNAIYIDGAAQERAIVKHVLDERIKV